MYLFIYSSAVLRKLGEASGDYDGLFYDINFAWILHSGLGGHIMMMFNHISD